MVLKWKQEDVAEKAKKIEGEVEMAYDKDRGYDDKFIQDRLTERYGKDRTVEEIVKEIDRDKEMLLGIEHGKYSKLSGVTDWQNREEVKILTEQAMSEETPTTGGTYEDNFYFSNILPKGQDKTPWNKEASTLIKNAAQVGSKKSDVLAAQNYFVDIGYMHPSEVDGKKGKQLMGMIRRWNRNAGTSKEALYDAMETWKDNIFGD